MFSRWFSWRFLLACLWFIAAGLLASAAHAKGTAAGTVIPNTATLEFVYEGKSLSVTAAPVQIMVDEVIDVTLTSQDSSLISVKAGQTARVLTFLVTNTGNGTETYNLLPDYAVTGDTFDPVSTPAGALYLENGKQAGLQTSGGDADQLLVPGGLTGGVSLVADASRLIYVLGDIPATTQDGSVGYVNLYARSTTAGAAGSRVGTVLPGLGDGGSDAVVGGSRAQAVATGGYVLSDVALKLDKTVVQQLDPRGGTRVMPGTVLTYRIVLTLTGTGVMRALTLVDPLPTSTTYVAGSLTVDGSIRTDAKDSDNAGVSDGVISITLGDTTSPSVHIVEFKATVN